MTVNKTEKHELTKLNVFEVSLVGKGINGKKFLTIKGDDDFATVLDGFQKAMGGDNDSFVYFLKQFVDKATPEQLVAVNITKGEVIPEVIPEVVETPVEGVVTKSDNSEIMKGIGSLKEMVQDLSVRVQDAEATIAKGKNKTKTITDAKPAVISPSIEIEKGEEGYISDEITLGNNK